MHPDSRNLVVAEVPVLRLSPAGYMTESGPGSRSSLRAFLAIKRANARASIGVDSVPAGTSCNCIVAVRDGLVLLRREVKDDGEKSISINMSIASHSAQCRGI
jgi:hypothetical protein